jgi:NAD+ kinase
VSPVVGLVVNGARPDALGVAAQTSEALESRGIGSRTCILEHAGHDEAASMLARLDADLYVSLGGDGTFLRAARRAHAADRPVLGVNFGRVGYLLDEFTEPLDLVLAAALEQRTAIERRACLQIDFDDGSSHVALNELSIEKTVPGHVVRIAASVDGEDLLSYAADGLLACTPTGSTAYNLSAGGPVLAPHLDAFVLTPVAPHLVLDRSVVLGGDQVVGLEVLGDRPAVAVLDGSTTATLDPGAVVTVRRHSRWLQVVAASERHMGRRLRESLRRGHE